MNKIAQYILVSLLENMYELANVLVAIIQGVLGEWKSRIVWSLP